MMSGRWQCLLFLTAGSLAFGLCSGCVALILQLPIVSASTHSDAHTPTHLYAKSHVEYSHASISCQFSQTARNPPPLKQKNLFLSCYRQTGARTDVSFVFSAKTKNITQIPTDFLFTVVLLQMYKALGQISYTHENLCEGKKKTQCDKKNMNMLIEPAEVAAMYLGSGSSLSIVPLLSVCCPEKLCVCLLECLHPFSFHVFGV